MKEFPRGTIDKVFRQMLMNQSSSVERSTASAKKRLHTALQEFAKEAAEKIKKIIEVQKMITAKKAAVDLAFDMNPKLTPLSEDNKDIRLQKSIVKRIIKDQGVSRVSDEAAVLFGRYVLAFAHKIVSSALEVAAHSGRKTIKEGDIEFALKHI